MGSDKDFIKAHHSLIDPLIELDPSEETGLNTHFRSTFAPCQDPPSPPGSMGLGSISEPVNVPNQKTGSSVETNPYRRSRQSSVSKAGPSNIISSGHVTPKRHHDYPSPPNSASPRIDHFSNYLSSAFGSMDESRPRRSSQPSSSNPFKDGHLSRGGSLRERYPGDNSVRPLDVLRDDTKKAYRTHHLRKKNFHGADIIDRLDKTGFSYHHEGPFDAANIARNRVWKHSPVAAVQDSNEEALRATPRENIADAITRHRPIEGVASVPPGLPDRFGHVLEYEEGADLQREPGGDYRRIPGEKYLTDDLKGKGEPSYSMDKALKDQKRLGDGGMELRTRHRRNQSLGSPGIPSRVPVEFFEAHDDPRLGRSHTTGKSMGSVLKKRFGSLRRRRAES
ncbi:hypothetical protein K504DRAFT_494116 [Pleomassaria siparia CBS 279.74]|uniref:Pal1-domain-containing protein n=1 Tax=Pleomassaria siparia CBS 279.74 TaxID=1314801 RepID=A0A6G1JYD3_9PLEO|nr:hypothetical protein K504DRAFT_494116 [Pleomassaria siparia CBS 279.74]